jgi:hypothetical protein
MSERLSGTGPVHPWPGPMPPEQPAAPRTAAAHGQARTGAPAAAARPVPPRLNLPPRDGNPLIAPGPLPALVTACLAALLAGAAALPFPSALAGLGMPHALLAVPVILLQAVTAAGWFRLNGMWPARQGIALAFLGGVAADVALLVADRGSAATVLLGTLGVWCLLVLVLQLRNVSSPDERLYALTATFTSAALAVLAAGFLAAAPVSADVVTVTASCAGVAALVRAVPLPRHVSPVATLVAAAGVGLLIGQPAGLGTGTALLTGALAGGCALIGLRVASYDFPSRFVHFTAGVALPLALTSPAAYVLARLLER